MRIAVLSDIHGNETALKDCLAHAEEQGAERYVFLGDYVGEMPWPERVMDCLYLLSKRYPCTFVRGNKEDYWLNADPAWQAGDSTTGMLWYNMQHLRQKDLAFFDGLPYAETLRLFDSPPVTLCHGTPENNLSSTFYKKNAPGFKMDRLKPGAGSSPIDSVGKERES